MLEQEASASAASVGKLVIDPQGRGYLTEPETEHQVAAQGDFQSFDHAAYIGAFGGEPNPLSVPLGTYYFLTTDYRLQKTTLNSFNQQRWEDASWADLLPTGATYRGHRHGDAAARPHMRMDGDVYHNDDAPRGIREVSNFVAGTSEHTDYDARRLAFLDEIPEVQALFVERTTLPEPTASDAPPLVHLTHDHREGNRADAVITVGFNDNGVGVYSEGGLTPAIGSINAVSPLLELFGLGDVDDYFVESVYWGNEADLDGFTHIYLNSVRYTLGSLTAAPGGTVWLKRITGYPTGLALASLSINFERADGSWYFNDSADQLLDAGLYQLTDDGQGNPIYDITPTRSVTHRDSVGPPSIQPHRAGIIDIDDLGRMYAAAGQVHRTITPPTGTTEVVPEADLGPQHVDNVSGFADLADRGGLGAWFAQTDHLNFIQIQGLGPPLNIDLVGTFHDVIIWIIANVTGGDSAANQFYRDNTTMLGLFHSEADALLELQFVLSGEAFPAVAVHQYLYVDATHGGGVGSNIRRVTVFNPGQFLRQDDFHWNSQADKAFVNSAIQAHKNDASAHHVKTPPGRRGGGGAMRLVQTRVELGDVDLTTNGVGTLTLSEPIVAGRDL